MRWSPGSRRSSGARMRRSSSGARVRRSSSGARVGRSSSGARVGRSGSLTAGSGSRDLIASGVRRGRTSSSARSLLGRLFVLGFGILVRHVDDIEPQIFVRSSWGPEKRNGEQASVRAERECSRLVYCISSRCLKNSRHGLVHNHRLTRAELEMS